MASDYFQGSLWKMQIFWHSHFVRNWQLKIIKIPIVSKSNIMFFARQDFSSYVSQMPTGNLKHTLYLNVS